MQFVVIFIVVIVVLAFAGSVVAMSRRRSTAGGPSAPGARRGSAGSSDAFERVRPPLSDFHVRGEDALAYFNVPLPAASPDPVLQQLLLREAVAVLAEKRHHGLPLEQVVRVRAFGVRDGAAVEVGSLDLEAPGVLPVFEPTELVPHTKASGYDPLAELGSQQLSTAPGLADISRTEDLPPIGQELELTSAIEAGLRSQGIDPMTMAVSDLAIALLKLGGYSVTPGGSESTFIASRAGSRTFLKVVDHTPGGYPELEERSVTEFLVGFSGANTDRGLLVTDKYGPFVIYDKERREPRCKFITRERLQNFVDSFSV